MERDLSASLLLRTDVLLIQASSNDASLASTWNVGYS